MDSFSPQQPKRVSIGSPRTSLPVIVVTAVMVLGLAFLLTSCESSLTNADGITVDPHTPIETANSHLAISNAELNKQLAAVRNLTAPFHNFDKAMEAGWEVSLTPCLELPGVGGMGYHYANLDFLLDAEWDVLKPEVLVYEPQKNGKLRLVAIEYVVPFDFYGQAEEAPVLFGQEFNENEEAGIWALHVWLWQHNPSGIFADWNPRVSCEFAPAP